jgi:hypothetical protein
LSKTQILIHNHSENINNDINNNKVSTDQCFEHGLGTIGARMAELESIDNLEF